MFIKATPQGRKLRMSIEGQSGSGKTTTALRVATGLVQREGGRIALIDAEEGRAKLEASRFDFDCSVISDYTPESYTREIQAAAKGGYGVLIIDTASKEWEALLNAKDNMPDKEQFSAWGSELNPRHDGFKRAIDTYPGHVIVTFRSKMKHVVQGGGDGKKARVAKLGVEPIARPGSEYDYDLSLELDHKSACALAKRPRGIFALVDGYRKIEPGEELGHQIADALAGKSPVAPVSDPSPAPAPARVAEEMADDDEPSPAMYGDARDRSMRGNDSAPPPRKRLAPGETHPALAPREPDRRDPTAPDNSHRDREGARIVARLAELAKDPPLGLGAAKCRQILGQTPMDTIPRRQAAVRILESALVKAHAGDAATVDLLRSLAERADLSEADCDSDARDRYGRPVSALTAGELAESCERLQMLAERLEREIAGAR